MSFFLLSLLFLFLVPSALTAELDERPVSVYTDLSGAACSLVKEDKETGSSVHKCPGVGGFELLVADDDARMSVSVIAPDHQNYPLNYWDVITPSFSHLGNKAEWRVIRERGKLRPIALIVRVVASDQSDVLAPKQIPYLAVAKISSEKVCVTQKIGPVKRANERAREAADQALKQTCLQPATHVGQ
jgi:hypothetical protein